MARYCSPSELAVYGINAEALADLPSEELIAKIDWASDLIDGYLRGPYTLPLVSWGSEIRGCCAVLAAWEAIRVRGVRPDESGQKHPLEVAADKHIKWLLQISGGSVHPEVTDSAPGAAVGASADRPFIASNEQRGYYTDGWRAEPFQGRRQS